MGDGTLDLRWILESLPVGLWVAQVPSGEVTYANPEFRSILGMDAVPESQIGDAPSTYGIFDRNGDPFPVEKLPFSLVVSTGRAAIVDDIVIHRPDGKKVNVRAFAFPAFDGDGKLSHVVIAFVDITQEVKAEVERDQTDSRLKLAVTHAPIVIWAADVNGVVTLSEGAGLASVGVKSGELVGLNLFELYKDHESISGYLRRGLAGESFWYTVQVGKAIYDTWVTPVRNAAGEIHGIAGLSNDVSEVRALQENAIQNDRAIALGTLAASVAHEINNPLTYMLGHLSLLTDALGQMEQMLPLLPEPARERWRSLTVQARTSIDPVREGTERIASITRELQTFSRSPVGGTAPVDLGAVVASVLKLMRKELEARARLEISIRKTAPVLANASRLVQVVTNLLVNALQALTGERSDSNTIWIGAHNEGATVVLEVADNGPGIPLVDRERIFEPFVTTKGIGEGTGLGLFVCRNIVRDYSGKVVAAERPGGGALLRVEFPAIDASSGTMATTSPLSENPIESSLGHVLIIDDEIFVAQTLSQQLSMAGYRASVEMNPGRALEMLSADGHDIDLIYCDLMMKAMSGMELADKLSARAPLQLRKMVFMTGGAFTPRARAFCEHFAGQCVDKPFNIVEETFRRLNPSQHGR